ncbi:CapA family protein [Halovivax limisalsi]|uniref:CapA family protein n=1 Tax=Halovivax limisalsi TaxID=1453760 RepID=UPI001FFC60B4|nr:CapA family protein [Halovivax limisalsi]
MSVRLGLAGDVMLGRLVDAHQRERPPEAVWGSALELLRELDGLFVNLECTLSTRGTPWDRTYRPFHFRADPAWAVPALEAAGVDGCSLANNHVLDYGAVALRDTLDALDDADIAHAGAGRTREAAFEPAFVELEDLRVAVFAMTDNTPEYAADAASPGIAHVEIDVDSEETRDAVRGALERARAGDPDLVIASLHWGPNMVESPPDAFRDFGRWLVDAGVDVVWGHSAHVFHGVEVRDGAPIVYDAGDFVDDYRVDPRLRNDRSFLFDLSVADAGRPAELRLHPTEIDDFAVHEAGPEAAAWSRERMQSRSEPFGTTFEREGSGLVLALPDE